MEIDIEKLKEVYNQIKQLEDPKNCEDVFSNLSEVDVIASNYIDKYVPEELQYIFKMRDEARQIFDND